MAITAGQLKATNITAAATSADYGTAPDQRRLYDFGDRVAELSPEESPFFVYLNKMSKSPTNDPVFRFLENRSKIDWTTRSFELAADVNGGSAVTAGTQYSFTVDDSSSGSASDVNWLQKGMVFAVQVLDAAVGTAYATVRVDSAVTDAGSSNTFTGRVIALPHSDFSTGYNILSNNDKCQVIGTSFEEGTGSPDVWSSSLDDDYGYTQIFKTAAEMTNTAIATNLRGYSNEWNRIWNLKLREHKVDIERAMLFGQRNRVDSIQYSEGIVGHVVKNSAPTSGDANLSYTPGVAYNRTLAEAEFHYDRLLTDFEVIYDPARGGSSAKLALAGLPVMSLFNKFGAGGLVKETNDANTYMQYNIDKEYVDGSFGHKLLSINTIHGDLSLVREPLFRGFSSAYMMIVDMGQVAYRPLVGNGLNRDTHIITNVQQADEDLRKDMILTEAGLEITLPETHCLYNFETIA
tara:strand:+ start:10489 stop:11877 length:1389 start_codon:yes stop_codon:yes gene_type:complete